MKVLLKFASFAGLILTIVPAFLVLSGRMTWASHAKLMFLGMIVWFCTAPFWMKSGK